MALPFLQESTVEAVLRVLRRSGVIADDASVNALRGLAVDPGGSPLPYTYAPLHNGRSDYEIQALVDELNLANSGQNGVARTGSPGDFYIQIDSDAQPTPKQDHVNYLRLVRWQEETEVVNEINHLFSAYWRIGYDHISEMCIGPDSHLLRTFGSGNSYNTARLYLGAYRKGGGPTVRHYGMLSAGEDESDHPNLGGQGVGYKCMRMHSDGSLLFSIGGVNTFLGPPAAPPIRFIHEDIDLYSGEDQATIGLSVKRELFGFYFRGNDSTKHAFYLGDVGTTGNPVEAMVISNKAVRACDTGYEINIDRALTASPADDWDAFRIGNVDTYDRFNMLINGDSRETYGHPSDHGRPSLLVTTAKDPHLNTCAAFVAPYADDYDDQDLILGRVNDWSPSYPNRFNYLNLQTYSGGWKSVFRVDNRGTLHMHQSGIAEHLECDVLLDPGTVVVVGTDGTINIANGFNPTLDTYPAQNVIGVVVNGLSHIHGGSSDNIPAIHLGNPDGGGTGLGRAICFAGICDVQVIIPIGEEIKPGAVVICDWRSNGCAIDAGSAAHGISDPQLLAKYKVGKVLEGFDNLSGSSDEIRMLKTFTSL